MNLVGKEYLDIFEEAHEKYATKSRWIVSSEFDP